MTKKLITKLIWIVFLLTLTYITACKEVDTLYRLISLCTITIIVFAAPYIQIFLKKYRKEN